MKFGDLVINEWAGNRNPHKVMMFVRKTQWHVYCLAKDGQSIEFHNDNDLRLTKAGTLDLTGWEKKTVKQSMSAD